MDLVVIVEGPADARTACDLADRVIVEEGPHWLGPHTRDAMRTWTGLQQNTDFTQWTEVKTLAQQKGVRNLGHPKSGQPGGADLAQARKAIVLHVLMTQEEEEAPALILVRDTDAERRSRHDLQTARQQPENPDWLTVVIGVANPKREAWVLNGFDPKNEDEEEALAELREELGRDPRINAHTLKAASTGAQNNAKRVLEALVSSFEREQQCWLETDLDTLRERGQETGLATFLEEVENRLLLLFRARPD